MIYYHLVESPYDTILVRYDGFEISLRLDLIGPVSQVGANPLIWWAAGIRLHAIFEPLPSTCNY